LLLREQRRWRNHASDAACDDGRGKQNLHDRLPNSRFSALGWSRAPTATGNSGRVCSVTLQSAQARTCCVRASREKEAAAGAYAPSSHFFMKLLRAAPASGLPSLPTALGSQASALHFFKNAVFAAPARGFPSLPTALLPQVSCPKADPTAKAAIKTPRTSRFMFAPPPDPPAGHKPMPVPDVCEA